MKHGIAQEPFCEFQIFLLILGEHHLKFHSCNFPEWEILRFRVMTQSLMGELHHIDEISEKSTNVQILDGLPHVWDPIGFPM